MRPGIVKLFLSPELQPDEPQLTRRARLLCPLRKRFWPDPRKLN